MQASDLKTGTIFQDSGEPYVVTKYTHTKVARGGASVKVKARNLISGQLSDFNFKSNQNVSDAYVSRKSVQFLYKEGNTYHFMDTDDYTQFRLSKESIGEQAAYMADGESVMVLYFENKPVSVELPNSMVFEVTYTEPGHKGNTVSTVYKDATLNNGTVVKVPSFIKIGEKVKIDTRSGEYMSKA